MRKISYPANLKKFKDTYLEIFSDFTAMKEIWEELYENNQLIKARFPKNIKDILLADYHNLCQFYKDYLIISSNLDNETKGRIMELFDYSKRQPSIAFFFMQNSERLNLSICHYCETAYINSYQITDETIESEGLEKVNNFSFQDLKKFLKLSEKSTRAIINHRPYNSVEGFYAFGNKNKLWRKERKLLPSSDNKHLKNHFDVDHVLDKDSSPITALSLMNFVPCCQVCNQKLKKTKILGYWINNKPEPSLSPTSPNFDFEKKVKIKIIHKDKLKLDSIERLVELEKSDNFILEFICLDPKYLNFLNVFRLRERYDYHKPEALYWLKMKIKYNEAHISLIANSFKDEEHFNHFFTEDRIREDIFQQEYDNIRNPCFKKLKSDILSQND